MARLKQHLVKEHKVPSERLGYFKEKSFRNLGPLEAKWVCVYRTLFPDVIEEDVPLSYKTAATVQRLCVIPDSIPAIDLNVFAHITTRFGSELNFAAANGMLYNTLQINKDAEFSTSNYSGLPTPPSSTETSPELGNLSSSPNSELESLSQSPATTELSSNDFIDPLLFADQDMGSSFPHDTTITDPVRVLLDPIASTDHPVIVANACLDCPSKYIFKTTGRGPSIYVCGNCHSTNLKYGVLSEIREESPQASEANMGVFTPTLTTDSSKISEQRELVDVFVGADRDYDINLDEWTFLEDSYNAPLIDGNGSFSSDVDKLFET